MQHVTAGISGEGHQHQKVNSGLEKNVMGKRKRSGSFSKTDECGAKKSDDCDSQEELDFDNVSPLIRGLSNSATRCSARVQEKQEKLRREASPSKQTISLEIHNCPLSAPGSIVCSIPKGSTKHSVATFEDPTGCHQNETVPMIVSSSVGLEEKRKKRNWELWSVEDKQLFFEALNEFGKDFDAIQNYFATKLKPRSKSIACSQYAPKNKDQVRHFYYRTWNKISKHLRFPMDMKKASQELYGLINYGELRKKQRVLNSKSAVKLSELVENGITSIKFRGKTCRIKTPVCRALKRLNGLEYVEHTRVPHKLGIEFIPRDGKTWRAVQSVSHNPRVKVYVSLQRTLASVITFFEERWKRNEDRLKEQFSTVFGKPRCRLRAVPMDTRELNIPVFRVAENTSSTTICLRAYTEHVLSRERNYELELAATKLKRKRKQSGSGCPIGMGDPSNVVTSLSCKHLEPPDYSMVDGDNSDVESQYMVVCQPHKSVKATNDDVRFPDEPSNEIAWMRFEKKWHDHEDRHESMEIRDTEIVNTTPETDNDDIDHDPDDALLGCPLHMEADDQLCACGSGKPAETENFVSHVWDDERIKLGWTSDEAGVMTIGEVYLMLGQAEKLCFEYSWDTNSEEVEDARCRNLLDRLIASARLLKKKKTSRSKAVLSNSGVVNSSGSLINCTKCGTKSELLGKVLLHSKEGSTPGALNNIALANCSNFPKSKGHFSTFVSDEVCVNIFPSASVALTDSTPAVDTHSPVSVTSGTDLGTCKMTLEEGVKDNDTNLTGSKISAGLVESHVNTKLQADDVQNPQKGSSRKITTDENKPEEKLRNDSNELETPHFNSLAPYTSQDNSKLLQSLTIFKNGRIDVSSFVTNHGSKEPSANQSIAPNIKPVLLPASSTTAKSNTGLVAINHVECNSNNNVINVEGHRDSTLVNETSKPSCIATPLDMLQGPKDSQNFGCGNSTTVESNNKEKSSFRRPATIQIAVRSKDAGESSRKQTEESSKVIPPKPFLDLPKGNRRLGRRPNFKRVVIPRVLPLRPKSDELLTVVTISSPCMSGSGIISASSIVPISVAAVPSTATATSTEAVSTNLESTNTTTQSTVGFSNSEKDSTAPLSKPVIDSAKTPLVNDKNNKHHLSKPVVSEIYNNVSFQAMGMGNTPSSISCSSNDFQDLLKVRQQESNSNLAAGDMDSLSLSSFMEISLPESARVAANECINTDLQIDDLENSNCSINTILNSEMKSMSKSFYTPEKQQPLNSETSHFEESWTEIEPGDMSLSSIFGTYDSARGVPGLSENDINFQSIMSDGSLDFSSKLTGLSSPMPENRK